ncbi:MAG: HDOD domain-containing protein [Desulfatitalea sp.]|nr:HDOD domain-containing protein [Desulfatitalea sp.]NNJ99360.1 HDOD domain-containing protein [Desulfatitalea sp.]
MAFIAVDDLEPGMVLSEDVFDVNTRLLLSKGQQIVPKHIRVLKIWGVNQVKIIGDVKGRSKAFHAADPEKEASVKQALDTVFKHLNLEHPIFQEIYQASQAYRLQHDLLPPESLIPPRTSAGTAPKGPHSIKKRIQKLDEVLPEAPFIVTELNQVIADDRSTSNDLARVVNKSPSLSAVLLKIVNSAFYGFPSKIDRISRAVTIIGTKQISSIALGISVMQSFKDIPEELVDMQGFLRHSLTAGLTARVIAALNNLLETEQLFVSGLLHDIGKLIVYKYFPEYARETLYTAMASNSCVFAAEKKVMGLNHTQIARLLLKKWHLPSELEDMIVHHHSPNKAASPKGAGIVQFADLLAHGLGIGSSGERSIPGADPTVPDDIGIGPHTLHTVIRQVSQQLAPLEILFES